MRQDQGKENEHRCPAHGGRAEGRGRAVHQSGEEGTCGALYEDGAIPLPQPVELCTTDDYNYSESCTFTNLQLQFLLHYYGQLRWPHGQEETRGGRKPQVGVAGMSG